MAYDQERGDPSAAEQRPNLSLGQPPSELTRKMQRPSQWLLTAVLVLQVAVLARLLIPGNDQPASRAQSAHAEELKQVAMGLENKSLSGPAAEAWQEWLDETPDAADRPEVLYRIGRLYMEAEQFDRAIAALMRCEQIAADDHLKDKVGPHIVTCLRRLGMYGEVGRELSRQVATGAGGAEPKVLATLAGEPITEADVDRMLERQVDQMLAVQGRTGDERSRQMMLKQFDSPNMRARLLQDLLRTELFTRRARELKLDQESEFQAARQAVVDGLLASRFEARELNRIQPTEVDLQAFYELQKDQYRQPESLQLLTIKLADDDDPAELLKQVESADDFRKLAADRLPEAEREKGPSSQTVIRGRVDPVLGNVDKLFDVAVGKWTTDPHTHGESAWLVLVEAKTPPRVSRLDEVRPQLQAEYIGRKRQELSEQLFRDLLERYDVKIVAPASVPEESAR